MLERLDLVRKQLAFTRGYTRRLLDAAPQELWFQTPSAGASCIAWQVGHLAMAEYRLALERVRGTLAEDDSLVPQAFLAAFGRDSQPGSDAVGRYSAAELLAVFDRVHAAATTFLETLDPSWLDLPVQKPHSIAKSRFDALLWCIHHEGVHAGQIGLLRRQLGLPPLW